MSEITLTAEVRKVFGRRAKTLRTVGKIPGVFYGHGQQNIAVSLLEASLRPLYTTTATHVINLKLDDGSTHLCVLRDVQLDPVTEKPVHFDLLGLNENENVTIEVPVKITGGIPKGVRDGGILQQVLHKLRVSCLPKNIPDHVEINVGDLAINHSIHVKDISIPNVTIVENETSSIVGVVPPTVQKEAEAAATTTAATPAEGAAAAPAEPEVIAKGKKPEEGAEEAAPAKAAPKK